MANVLSEDKKQQVIALERLGWTLRRIQQATGVRRETASTYLKATGIDVRPPGGWGRRTASKPAIEVTADFGVEKAAPKASTGLTLQEPTTEPIPQPHTAKPVNQPTTDSARPGRSPTASACEPCRELIELAVARGRNAMAIWQNLLSQAGFDRGYQSVKRFVRRLRGTRTPEAPPAIVTEPGDECQVDCGPGPRMRDPQAASIDARASS
jgi:hypothetical protein